MNLPKPNIKQQIVNPAIAAREKSILYSFSIVMMHAPASTKCLGEEKSMCNLQKKTISYFTTSKISHAMHYTILQHRTSNPNII